jgi:hypothetical protein
MSSGLNGKHCEKAKELAKSINALKFRLSKALKNVKWCRETCKSTGKMIGELNGRIEEDSQRTDVRKAG